MLGLQRRNPPARFWSLIFLPVFILLMLPAESYSAVATLDEFSALGEKFDHLTTGYELTGEHSLLECGDCHIGGVFETLPKVCSDCHDNVIAIGKPSIHIVTESPCDTCHNTTGFLASAIMDHSILERVCAACHDGITATGKTIDHLTSTNACELCHTTNYWDRVDYVNHDGILNLKSCGIACHVPGLPGTNQPAGHINTAGNYCGGCHLPEGDNPSWPLICSAISHTWVAGACSDCHTDSGPAFGPNHYANHLATTGEDPTSAECNSCHSPPSACQTSINNW